MDYIAGRDKLKELLIFRLHHAIRESEDNTDDTI